MNDLSTRDREYVGDFDDEFDAPDDDLDADYDDYDYLPPAGRRWHPVAVIAGGVLIAAVVATVGIVNSDDSGTKSATVGPPPRTAVAAPTTAPAAPEPPSGSRAPETVTTVPPGPTPSRQPHAAPVAPPAPAAPVAPAAPGAAPHPAPPGSPAVNPRTVVYSVTGAKQPLDLVNVIYIDEHGLPHTDVNVALPWTKTVVLDPSVNAPSVTATSLFARLNCSVVNAAGQPIAAAANKSMIATCTR